MASEIETISNGSILNLRIRRSKRSKSGELNFTEEDKTKTLMSNQIKFQFRSWYMRCSLCINRILIIRSYSHHFIYSEHSPMHFDEKEKTHRNCTRFSYLFVWLLIIKLHLLRLGAAEMLKNRLLVVIEFRISPFHHVLGFLADIILNIVLAVKYVYRKLK